jgi:hypothetical protein
MTQNTASEAPEFVQTIVSYSSAEFTGMSSDKNRFGLTVQNLGTAATNLALKNGFVVENVKQEGLETTDTHLTFVRLGFNE